MDEFNPYAPPATRADLIHVPSTPGYRLYLVLNLLYAGLLGICLLVLLVGGSIRLAVPDMLVVGIFLAPLLSSGWWWRITPRRFAIGALLRP